MDAMVWEQIAARIDILDRQIAEEKRRLGIPDSADDRLTGEPEYRSRYERRGTRSLTYSKWHRFYLGDADTMIDLDGVDYCPVLGCSKPFSLVETAMDIGQAHKPSTVLRELSAASGITGLCVLYRVAADADPLTGCDCEPHRRIANCRHGIDRFRVRVVGPQAATRWIEQTPAEYRRTLRTLRRVHFAAEHPHLLNHPRLWEEAA